MLHLQSRCRTLSPATRAFLLSTVLLQIAAFGLCQSTSGDPAANVVWEETRRWNFGSYTVIEEVVTADPDGWVPWFGDHRSRIVNPFGDVTISYEMLSHSISTIDFTGDGRDELVVQGNSGGVSGCCDFLEVMTLEDGQLRWLVDIAGDGRNSRLVVRQLDGIGSLEVLTENTLMIPGMPFCCNPLVPVVLTWTDEGLADVTEEVGGSFVEDRMRSYQSSLSGERLASLDPSLDTRTAAAGYLGTAYALGPAAFARALDWLNERSSESLQRWLVDVADVLPDEVSTLPWP